MWFSKNRYQVLYHVYRGHSIITKRYIVYARSKRGAHKLWLESFDIRYMHYLFIIEKDYEKFDVMKNCISIKNCSSRM